MTQPDGPDCRGTRPAAPGRPRTACPPEPRGPVAVPPQQAGAAVRGLVPDGASGVPPQQADAARHQAPSDRAPSDQAVIDWYQDHARDLPWRRPGTTPWGVLVSEVMSQQTPVSRVTPAWTAWMARWAGPADLAGAPVAEVLHAWGRLGYPRRALRLRECAAAVVEWYDGVLPADPDALLALPGVGEYTAGAVLAFAYGRRALALDTNVRRVLARAVGGSALPAPSLVRAERDRAAALLPLEDARAAQDAGADVIGTTLAGYTGERPRTEGPDIELIDQVAAIAQVPLIVEGRVHTPAQAAQAMDHGAFAVVVGTAITHPTTITSWFASALPGALWKE